MIHFLRTFSKEKTKLKTRLSNLRSYAVELANPKVNCSIVSGLCYVKHGSPLGKVQIERLNLFRGLLFSISSTKRSKSRAALFVSSSAFSAFRELRNS